MGTTFNQGQLAQLSTNINIAVATVLPELAGNLDPKITLRALEGRGEVFAGHMKTALEQAINRMLMLGSNGSVAVKLAERHDPDTFYRTGSGLYVYNGFRNLIVAKAKPTEAGAIFKLDHALLTKNMKDEEIENSLPKNHLFDDSAACAVIAAMIKEQPNGKEDKLLNNGYANLFYTSSCVVYVCWYADYRRWDVNAWKRGGGAWSAGGRVFSPATGT